MAAAKPKPQRARVAPDISALLIKARETLKEDGVLKLAALGPATVRAELTAQLVSEGFEATKSVLRRPLAAQLSQALADGAFIALKALKSHVVGATPAEAKRAVLEVVRAGGARLVLRGTEEVLVPVTAPVLSREELRRFAELAKGVAKVAGAKNGLSMLKSDLLESLDGIVPAARIRPEKSATAEKPPEALKQLLTAVDAARDATTGLSFIPNVVHALSPELGSDRVRAVLLEAAMAGVLELRPEGGLNRLSEEELALCPPGPQGTHLSWARRAEQGSVGEAAAR